jgi:hypothetical protein
MAGKIWNTYDAIYVTGWSSCEMDKKEYKKHIEIIDKWNEEIKLLLADHA